MLFGLYFSLHKLESPSDEDKETDEHPQQGNRLDAVGVPWALVS
jgi:hypothetical protein